MGASASAVVAEHGEGFTNGVRFYSVQRSYTATTSIAVFIKGGIFRETAANSGIGALAMNVWAKGGKLLELLEGIGGHIDATSSLPDFHVILLSVPTDTLSSVLPEFKKQLLEPEITSKLFNKEKDLLLRAIEAMEDDPNSVAFDKFMETTYGSHPYALHPTTKSVSKLKLGDVERHLKGILTGADMVVAVSGRYSVAQLNEMKAIFKQVPAGVKCNVSLDNASIVEVARREGTDSRIQQAKVFLAYTAPSASSEDYVYAKIISDLLGGGMSSPYFSTLRKNKGYAYSVGMMYPSRLADSRMIGHIGLQVENIEDAIKTMQQLNAGFADKLKASELAAAKNHIVGERIMDMEANARSAWFAAFYESLGLGFDYSDAYIKAVRAAKIADIKRVGKNIFGEKHTIFILSPSKK
ncbi:pitrilysin family protein [Deferribacterales bacterium RsTz2092]|nr:peptidase M16 [Deferribacterales bacterium]